MHLTNHDYFDLLEKPKDPQIEPHVGIKMAQSLVSLVYICGPPINVQIFPSLQVIIINYTTEFTGHFSIFQGLCISCILDPVNFVPFGMMRYSLFDKIS